MSYYIVIPPPAFNLPPAATIRGMAAAAFDAVEPVAPVAPKNLGDLLRHKRGELLAFANVALASAAGIGGMMAATAAFPAEEKPAEGKTVRRTRQKQKRGPAAAPEVEQSPVIVLEGVGALIMPEEMVDRAVLEGAMGATVIENFFIPLEEPVPVAGAAVAGTLAKDWHLKDINVAAAAAQGFQGKGMLAGVLDTGIDAQGHPEFAGKTIYFAEFDATGRMISNQIRDAGSHGTHVCGIIAGKTAGVAPQADLAVAAVLTIAGPRGLGGYFAQILGGMNWLITYPFTGDPSDPGVDVMNASLGGVGYNAYYYPTLANARLATGTVLVAAIGNGGPAMNQHGSPGNYDIVVGVGAIDPNRDVANFSDWGVVAQHGGLRKPDLCAPGAPVWSSLPGRRYGPMSGTSMASPVVTGALALLLQKTPAFSLNATGLVNRLSQLVTPLSGASNIQRGGSGRLDLSAF
jgi:subtilisin family serine protease